MKLTFGSYTDSGGLMTIGDINWQWWHGEVLVELIITQILSLFFGDVAA